MSENAATMDSVETPKKLRRGGRQTRFLAQSVILEEAGSSGLVRVAMITICAVICLFLAWAAITDVDEVAVTSGEIVPTGQVQSIQHLEGGIIARISVEDGQLVDDGESLVLLDPTSAMAELKQLQVRQMGFELQAERLRALGTGREPDFSFAGPEFKSLVDDQWSVYEGQFDAAANRSEVLIAQIEQRKQELAQFDEKEETLSRSADIILEELSLREELYKKGLTPKLVYLDVKRQVNEVRGELANMLGERLRTEESLAEARSRLAELETNDREQALAEMGTVTNELAEVNESVKKALERVRRLDIRAPVRGIVMGLAIHTVGGVIPPGAVVLEVVPLDKELIVETRITTRDVGHVKVGHPVTIKVTTFDFARYGGISGELKDVSASTFLDEEGEPYYRGVVTLDRGYVGGDPELNRVLPGMTVQADIKTGKKTLLAYLLKPVVSSVKTSFRER